MQATYFDQKFHATFFLAPEEAGLAAKPPDVAGTRSVLTPRASNPRSGDTAQPVDHVSEPEGAQDAKATPKQKQRRSPQGPAHSASSGQRAAAEPREGPAAQQPLPANAGALPHTHPLGLRQEAGGPAQALDAEWEEELIATIEEQDQALR